MAPVEAGRPVERPRGGGARRAGTAGCDGGDGTVKGDVKVHLLRADLVFRMI